MEDRASEHMGGTRAPERWVAWAVAALVVAAAFVMALKPLRSPDVWHHVACGRLAAGLGGPARADVFSCTAQGQRWIQYEWLAQWTFYQTHRFGGVTGLILLRAGAVALTALLLLMACRARKGTAWPACGVALALALLASSGRFFTRPELFTWLCLAGMMWALEALRRGRHGLFWVPALLMVPWVNMHGAWPAGLALLGLTCAGETALVWAQGRPGLSRLPLAAGHEPLPSRTLRRLWTAFGLALAATLINPFGFHIWEVPFKLAGAPEIHRVIAEWHRPGLAHWLDPQHVGAYVALAACALGWRTLRPADALVVLFFGALSLTAVRHIAVALLITAPTVAAALAALGREALVRAPRLEPARPWTVVAGVALLCALCVWLAMGLRFQRFGVRLDDRVYPLGAAAFLEGNALDGNLFNSYTYGNYLLYARYPRNLVFIDGRVDMYGTGPLQLYETVINARPDWPAILARYDVDLCVIETARPPEPPLLRALHRSPEWALTYWDAVSAVYVRRSPRREAFLAQAYVYSVYPRDFDPALTESPERLQRAERDYRRRLTEDPACVLALYGLGRCLEARGKTLEAMAAYRAAVEADPAAETVWYAMGICALKMDALGGAAPALRRVLELNPKSVPALLALCAVELRQSRPGEAEAVCRRALKLEPGNWKIHANLARVREAQGDLPGALAAAGEAARLDSGPAARALLQEMTDKTRKRGGTP